MINIEHQSNVEFLAQFKEANKETRYQSFYDPIQKIRILKPISIDPNAFKFRDNNIKTDADINKEKRQKRAKSPYGVRPAQIKETKPPKIKAEKIIKERIFYKDLHYISFKDGKIRTNRFEVLEEVN